MKRCLITNVEKINKSLASLSLGEGSRERLGRVRS